ncbi:Ig-like domain-containing protein [Leucothrix arctica]|uniref:Galactose oxidase-like Early set domain-containing protein n=1 Tax=Leucothrix arctica TaxID=1481894 RepID=A0A317CMW0_9GAMM|nr:galactose oxidase-like domain-containing protein [Leucothrix arctica]PWQ99551.1 hypothetical protein DKT75_00330 [Leucothrix arctica]
MNLKINLATSLLLASAFTAANAAPDTEGQWTQQADWPMIAIHAVLTPQGKILTWGVDGISSGQFQYDMWDPALGLDNSSHTVITSDISVTSFCSAGLVLPESGNVLMPGGDARPEGLTNSGITSVAEFNPQNNGLSRAAEMSYARWYPTSITLPDGDILVSGGRDGQLREIVTPEVYSPSENQWRSLFGVNTTGYGYYYPKLWVIPDGRIFGMQSERMYYMTADGQGTLTTAGTLPQTSRGNSSTAVMYSPGKIMQISGESSSTTNGTLLVDVTGSSPSVRETNKPAEAGRLWANTVVLPNGKVMVVGGSAVLNAAGGASYRPEIWDPATEQWSLMAESIARRMRLYHSVAILLEDGRILVAGGGAPGPEDNKNAEIFTPPYLFDESGLAQRPTISSAPEEAPYGASISVSHPTSDTITRVTLIKTGAVTHAFNMEQRFIEAEFTDTSEGVRVQIPDSANVATPGHYLMFLINDKGVPSTGHIIRISDTAVYNESPYPVALTDAASATAGTALTLNVLTNDIGSSLTVSDYNQYSQNGGTITKNGNNLVYTSAATFSGEDTFWYVITDNIGRTNSAKVTVNVTGGINNPFPVGTPDTLTATSGNTVTIDVLANDTGNGLVLIAPNTWSLNGGNVALANNQITYTADASYVGEDKIWYSFRDIENRQSWSVVTINVINGGDNNPAPIGNADSVQATTATTTVIDVLANDIGNGLSINTLNSAWSLNGGTVSLSNNKLNYQSKAGYVGEDKIWYTFSEVEGRSSWGEVTVNVTP